jgi:arylsulfatase A-like enzyme
VIVGARPFFPNQYLVPLLSVVLMAACGLFPPTDEPVESGNHSATPRNLLLIVIDTLRADHVGSYGGAARTPSMDALAEAGVRFDRAYSHIPVTAPSHATMFTGTLPFQHGVKINTQVLDGSFSTLAEVLRDRGWRTGAVVSLGVLKAKFGLGQGFEQYDDAFDRQWHRPGGEVTDAALRLINQWPSEERFFAFVHYSDPHSPYAPPGLEYPNIRVVIDDRPAGTVSANGVRYLIPLSMTPGTHEIRFEAADDGTSKRMAFEQLRIKDPRVSLTMGTGWNSPPGSKPEKQNRTVGLPASVWAAVDGAGSVEVDLRLYVVERLTAAQIRERYLLEVEYADREIGRFLGSLEESGHLSNTVVVLTSDHGEGLGDHDLVGHIHQLYDTLTRVPLVVVAPGLTRPGTVSRAQVRHVDLRPTVLVLLGVNDPVPGDGVDFGSSLVGQEFEPIPPHIAMTFRPLARADLRAIIMGRHKLIREVGSDRAELYDLEADPGELDDLLTAEGSAVGVVAAMMARHLDDVTAQLEGQSGFEARKGELNEEDLEQLRALGYLQ